MQASGRQHSRSAARRFQLANPHGADIEQCVCVLLYRILLTELTLLLPIVVWLQVHLPRI